MSPFHIELVGLPGAGKTTVANELSSSSLPNSYQLRIGYKLAICRSLCTPHLDTLSPYLPIQLVEFLAKTSGITDHETYRERHATFIQTAQECISEYTVDSQRIASVEEWVLAVVIQYSTAMDRLSTDEFLLCDEGFLQRGVATFCPPDPQKQVTRTDVRRYLSSMPGPDLVVFLDIPIGEAISRMQSRSEGPPASFQDDIRGRLERIQQVLNEFESAFADLGIEYIRIDNDCELGDACQQIAAQVQATTSVSHPPDRGLDQ